MAKNYSHEISVPRILVDANGVRTTMTGSALNRPKYFGAAPGSGTYDVIDNKVPDPISDPSLGSSIIFNIGGPVRSRGPNEGE